MMRGKVSKSTVHKDDVVAYVHITFGSKYTSVFYLDEDREVIDMEIFKTGGRRGSRKKAQSLSVSVFHSMYESLMDLAFPGRQGQK